MIDEKSIIRSIIDAQIASDAGKPNLCYNSSDDRRDRRRNNCLKRNAEGYSMIPMHDGRAELCRKKQYEIKEFHIVRAIQKLNCTNFNNINYYVVESPDQNGYDSIITYFDIKTKGKRFQISFHTPWNKASKELKNSIGKGRPTRWRKNQISSRQSCLELIEIYGLA